MKSNDLLKQHESVSKHSSSLLSTFFSDLCYCNERQASYIQYPDLNPFYFCDAATELIEPQRSSPTSILTAMVNSLSMIQCILCSSYQAEQEFQELSALCSMIVLWKITDLASNFYSKADEKEISNLRSHIPSLNENKCSL